MRASPRIPLLLLAAVAFLASGCAPRIADGSAGAAVAGQTTLSAGHTLGQTFAASRGGLAGVDVALAPDPGAQGDLTLHLRAAPTAQGDLATATVSVAGRGSDGLYHFTFSPHFDSYLHYYYALLEYQGTGTLRAPAAAAQAYADGVLYRDGEPQEAQAIFGLVYNPAVVVAAWLASAAAGAALGGLVLAVLFLAGYGIVRSYVRRAAADFTVTLVLGAAAALAAYMTLLVWANLAGIRFGGWTIRGLAGLAAAAGLVLFWRDRAERWGRPYWLGRAPAATLAFWAVVLGGIALRLFAGAGQLMLPGADSYHHTVITQLFLDQGGIPHDYAPYAPMVSFSYHFGFHSMAALAGWLLGSDLLNTVKITAIVVNGAIAATVGLLAERVTGQRRAAVIAAVLISFVLVAPFCLLMWSRFTQAAGLLFLGLALWAVQRDHCETGWLLAPLMVAAVIFSHYRVTLYWALLMVVLGLAALRRRDWPALRNYARTCIIAGVLAGPWLAHVLWVQYDPQHLRLSYPMLAGYNNGVERLGTAVWGFVTNVPVLVVALALTAAALLIRNRQNWGGSLIVWCLALVAGAIVFPLTGSWFWELTTTLLSLPVPLALLAGMGGEALWSGTAPGLRRAAQAGLALALVLLGGLGAARLPGLVQTNTPYLRPGDLAAMKWISQNTPPDANFLVGGFQIAWSPGWVVGSDAGYWLPLLTHRRSVLPPMIYDLEWSDPAQVAAGLDPYYRIQTEAEAATPSASELARQAGITHILANIRQAALKPQNLAKDPGLRPVYRQDWFVVYQVTQ